MDKTISRKERHETSENNKLTYLIIVFFSFIMILIFSKSSPLYFINDWVDANAFFSLGKGMVHGKIPYKDLFEQKGVLLYFLHAIAYKISNTSFLGVYVLESLSFSVTLVLYYRIVRFYFKKNLAILITFLAPLFLLNKDYFRFGDSAEEFAFPFILGLLYLIFYTAHRSGKSYIRGIDYFIQGILMGCVFWIKYTMIGPWIAFFLFIGVYWIIKRKFQELFKAIFCSVLGLLSASLPWLFYFFLNNSLKDMIFVYFQFNMILYPQLTDQAVNVTLLSRFMNTLYIFVQLLGANKILTIVTIVGSINFTFTKLVFKQVRYRVLLIFMFLSTNFFTFYGGIQAGYYQLLNMPILLISLLSLSILFYKMFIYFNMEKLWVKRFLAATVSIMAVILMFLYNDQIKDARFFINRPSIQIKNPENTNPNAKQPAQLEFAKILEKTNDASLLNYGFVDYGFSVKPNIVPQQRYFMNVNIPYDVYPESMDEQNKYIENKQVDFVVAGLGLNDEPETFGTPWLKTNYKVVAVHVQNREGIPLKYVLYKKK